MGAAAYPTRIVGDLGIIHDDEGGLWLFQLSDSESGAPVGVRITRAEAFAVLQAIRPLVSVEVPK